MSENAVWTGFGEKHDHSDIHWTVMIAKMEKTPEISIVIPIYNEQNNVKRLYREIRAVMDALQLFYEIIFIDDGSTDDSVEYLKSIKRKELEEKELLCRTRIIEFARNFGQTLAMQSGFDHAQGHTIVTLDGDLQNDPADIPNLLKIIESGFDVVCGWRKNRQDKTTRVIPSMVANWMIRAITHVPIHDNGCSLKAFRSNTIKSVKLYSDMHRFIPAVTTMVDARITEVVVNHRSRKYGESKYGMNRIWKVMFDIFTIKMLIHFRQRPLKWFAIIAFLFCLLGICFGISSIFLFFNDELSMVFLTSSFLCFFLFGSYFMWGILAEFFINIESRSHPVSKIAKHKKILSSFSEKFYNHESLR